MDPGRRSPQLGRSAVKEFTPTWSGWWLKLATQVARQQVQPIVRSIATQGGKNEEAVAALNGQISSYTILAWPFLLMDDREMQYLVEQVLNEELTHLKSSRTAGVYSPSKWRWSISIE